MSLKQGMKGAVLIAAGGAGLFSSTLTFAQGCALCYTSAAAARSGAIHALRSGILILGAPTLLMFIAIFALAAYRHDTFNDVEAPAQPLLEEDDEVPASWGIGARR